MRRLLIVFAMLCFTVNVAYADGIIIPEPWVNLAIKYHRVEVEIRDQATTTSVDQVFMNEAEWDVEGTYLFPIPEGASISAFSMFVDGEPLVAEVMEADEAREIYESIVRKRIDPALLEYAGRGVYRARIFPIPGKGEKRVQMSYDEIIRYENGICRYTYPLNTEKFSSKPLEDVSVTLNIHSTQPIKSIYSPSHNVVIQKEDDHNARVIYAEENVTPREDFVLYYTVSEDDVGLNVLTYREPEEEGFYLLLASPKVELEQSEILRKRMLFVFDTSGSMAGEKIEQAKGALKFALNNLDSGDQFNIVDYSTLVSKFSDVSVEASSDNVALALDYVDKLQAIGGTNINEGLLTGLGFVEDDELANMVIFLTDGKPTIGVTEDEGILKNVREANVSGTRIFVFGVGLDVNTHLLDRLSGENHGVSTYVLPGEDIEVAVSSFYTKVSNPVLSNLSLYFGGITVSDFYPQELPDLFRGSQLIQLGRYDGSGETEVVLSGRSDGAVLSFTEMILFPSESTENEFLPRLWATRKIGFLLEQIRLHGEDPELTDEIIALSKRYGIITPYTSFLIVEDEPPPVVFEPAFFEKSGAEAVAASDLSRGAAGATITKDVQGEGVKYVGNKTFFFRDGFWRDSEYKDEPTLDYQYGSDRYFSLLADKPKLGRYLAIGKNVIVKFEGEVYRIGETVTKVEEDREESSIPEGFELRQNYPNPFNPTTTIRFTVPPSSRPLKVVLSVYNLSGQRIRTLVDGGVESGEWRAVWDGKDEVGEDVSSGIYLYQLTVDDEGQWSETRKMLLVR